MRRRPYLLGAIVVIGVVFLVRPDWFNALWQAFSIESISALAA